MAFPFFLAAQTTVEISSVEDFQKIMSDIDGQKNPTKLKNYFGGKTFKLTKDLDFSSVSAEDQTPRDFYNATFDGDGHIITGRKRALFATVGEGTYTTKVTNVGMYKSDIEPHGTSEFLGAIAQIMQGHAVLENCWVKECKLVTQKVDSYVGGLVGAIKYTDTKNKAQNNPEAVVYYSKGWKNATMTTESGSGYSLPHNNASTVARQSWTLVKNCCVHNTTLAYDGEGTHNKDRYAGLVGSMIGFEAKSGETPDKTGTGYDTYINRLGSVLIFNVVDNVNMTAGSASSALSSEKAHHFVCNYSAVQNLVVCNFYGHYTEIQSKNYEITAKTKDHCIPKDWLKSDLIKNSTDGKFNAKEFVHALYDANLDQIRQLTDVYLLKGDDPDAVIERDDLLAALSADSIATVTKKVTIPADYPADYPVNGILIAEGGSVIDLRENGFYTQATVQKELPVTKSSDADAKWTPYGMTVTDQTSLEEIFATSQVGSANDIAVTDLVNNDWEYLSIAEGDHLDFGKGYLVYAFDVKPESETGDVTVKTDKVTIEVSGPIYTGATKQMDFTVGGSAVNGAYSALLSNPYPSDITLDKISGTFQADKVYVLRDNDWKTDADGIKSVGVGEAFAVCYAATGDQSVTVSKPTSYASAAKKAASTDLMKFTVTTNASSRNAYARMSESADNGFDFYDAFVMFSSDSASVSPYFEVDNRGIRENVFESLPYECPIGFRALKQTQAELTVDNIPQNVTVSIIDVTTGESTELTQQDTFSFVANEGDNAGRYRIVFNNSGVGIDQAQVADDDIRILQQQDRILIYGNNLRNAELVNMLGQTVASSRLSSVEGQLLTEGNTGAYVLKLTTDRGMTTKKVIIK